MKSVRHRWTRIEDLHPDWHAYARPDLDDSLRLWRRERATLKDPSRVSLLEERLKTLWAIETGVIERLYSIDRGTTETLVELGLDALEQFSTTGRLSTHAGRLIEDQRAALDFVFSYLRSDRQISTSYIKEMHQLLLRNQDYTEAIDTLGNCRIVELIRGDWKRLSNNPQTPDGMLHEYCPPEHVQSEMERLLSLHEIHEQLGVRPEVEAAWLHHRFTQIHPFQDGNGRVARALATMIFVKAGFLPLVIRDTEHRETYLHALELADRGDLAPLVALFANIQTQDLNDAITFVRDMRGEDIRQIAASAAGAAKRRSEMDQERVHALTERLRDVARWRLEEIATELKQAFEEAGVALRADVFASGSDEPHQGTPDNHGWWGSQIVSAAKEYRYYADLSMYRRWVQLRLRIDVGNVPRWNVVVSFHHKESRAGLMAAVVFLTPPGEVGEEPRSVILGADRELTYSAASSVDEDEFRAWLDDATRTVLQAWQSRL
jgi:Fic family protein